LWSFIGITLISDTGLRKAVSLSDIQSALNEVGSVINAAHPTNPLIVFYFAGHGISEGFAWNHFSVPGNFVRRGALNELSIEALTQKTLCAADLVDELQKWQVPFLVLLDTCYEGSAATVSSSILSGEAIKSIMNTAAVLRFMNEFHQKNPVLFSTTPGTVVQAVADPIDPQAPLPVGPLGRRLVLVLDAALRTKGPISLRQFLTYMCAARLDAQTGPAITHATPDAFWDTSLTSSAKSDARFEERLGTASVVEICGPSPDKTEVQGPKTTKRDVKGRIEISGPPGEFISDGRSHTFVTPSTKLVVDDSEPGSVVIEIGDPKNSWEIDLSAPAGGRFETVTYKDAQRFGFAEGGHAGISVSGPATGCNEISGSLTIENISFGTNGRLLKLVAIVIQRCDRAHSVLKAQIAIQAESEK
jgi:hypothetical protein